MEMEMIPSKKRKILENEDVEETVSEIHQCGKCRRQFDSINDLESHSSQKFCTEMSNLDDNCIDTIIEYLRPNDLAAMRMTCKRYKTLIERFLRFKFDSDKPLRIYASRSGAAFGFSFKEEYKYEKTLYSFIPAIEVVFHDRNSTVKVFEFIRKNCSDRILYLNICSLYDDEITGVHTGVIQNQFKHLKRLIIRNIRVLDIHQTVLQHCENLQELRIYHEKPWLGYGNAWLNRAYPKLESLTLQISSVVDIDLTELLRLNPNLKDVVCTNLSAIRSLCRSGRKLRNVTILLKKDDSLREVRNEIISWSQKKPFEKFELCSENSEEEIIDILTNVKNISSLHCRYRKLQNLLLKEVDIHLPSIEKLCTDFEELADISFEKFAKIFPNLRELVVYNFSDEDYPEDCLISIVSHSKLLERLTYPFEEPEQYNEDYINKLHHARERSGATSKLNVILMTDEDDNLTEPSTNLIELQTSELDMCKLGFYH